MSELFEHLSTLFRQPARFEDALAQLSQRTSLETVQEKLRELFSTIRSTLPSLTARQVVEIAAVYGKFQLSHYSGYLRDESRAKCGSSQHPDYCPLSSVEQTGDRARTFLTHAGHPINTLESRLNFHLSRETLSALDPIATLALWNRMINLEKTQRADLSRTFQAEADEIRCLGLSGFRILVGEDYSTVERINLTIPSSRLEPGGSALPEADKVETHRIIDCPGFPALKTVRVRRLDGAERSEHFVLDYFSQIREGAFHQETGSPRERFSNALLGNIFQTELHDPNNEVYLVSFRGIGSITGLNVGGQLLHDLEGGVVYNAFRDPVGRYLRLVDNGGTDHSEQQLVMVIENERDLYTQEVRRSIAMEYGKFMHQWDGRNETLPDDKKHPFLRLESGDYFYYNWSFPSADAAKIFLKQILPILRGTIEDRGEGEYSLTCPEYDKMGVEIRTGIGEIHWSPAAG